MDFRTLSARRKAAGLCGTLIICLSLALAVDGMIAGGRKDPYQYELVPGQSLALTDPLPRGAEGLAALDLRSSSPRIAVRMVETFSGFWLGGTLWRAEATLPQDLAPGAYTLSMHYQQNGTEAEPRQQYRLRVHKDQAGVQAASLSLVQRSTGLSPYLLAALLLPCALFPMAASFILSRKIGQALTSGGMAEVFRAMAGEDGQHIFFTQAGSEPLAAGEPVQVLDERAQAVLGLALVTRTTAGAVEAVMQEGVKVRPGVIARRQAFGQGEAS